MKVFLVLLAAAALGACGAASRSATEETVRETATCDLPTSAAAAEGVDTAAVRELLDSARATRSDAFLVLKNGRVISEWYSSNVPQPIQTMSATKSIVGLAIGQLLHEKKLDSLDQPVWTLYPEWRQGRKRSITIRHLMNHTSGLQDVPGDGAEIEPAPDAIQLALAAELMSTPGTNWFYSNKATNLLAGIVEKASGKPLDRYIEETLLRPLGARDAFWQFRDRKGNPYAMAGLALHARDMAKIGQLMLDVGRCNGTAVLPGEWVRVSVQPSQALDPRYGLLWWIEPAWWTSSIDSSLMHAWTSAGIAPATIDRLAPLIGRTFDANQWPVILDSAFAAPAGSRQGMHQLSQATRAAGVPMRRIAAGPSRGYYANGSLGQWLFVIPEEKIVIVRQIARRPGHAAADNFHNLPALALRLLAPR